MFSKDASSGGGNNSGGNSKRTAEIYAEHQRRRLSWGAPSTDAELVRQGKMAPILGSVSLHPNISLTPSISLSPSSPTGSNSTSHISTSHNNTTGMMVTNQQGDGVNKMGEINKEKRENYIPGPVMKMERRLSAKSMIVDKQEIRSRDFNFDDLRRAPGP